MPAAQLALDTLVTRRDGLTQQAAPVTGAETSAPKSVAATPVQTMNTNPDFNEADWGDHIDPDLLELTPITEFM